MGMPVAMKGIQAGGYWGSALGGSNRRVAARRPAGARHELRGLTKNFC